MSINDNVWWSLGFCGKRTSIGCLIQKQQNCVRRKNIPFEMFNFDTYYFNWCVFLVTDVYFYQNTIVHLSLSPFCSRSCDQDIFKVMWIFHTIYHMILNTKRRDQNPSKKRVLSLSLHPYINISQQTTSNPIQYCTSHDIHSKHRVPLCVDHG